MAPAAIMVIMRRTISQAELRNASAAVLDALEAGEEFIITRNGVPVGELRPIRPHRELSATELVELFASLPAGSTSEQIRAEVDDVFGEDRIGDDCRCRSTVHPHGRLGDRRRT